MRNMAYIVTIKDKAPIEGKDRIQYVHFNENGYGCIADKTFNVGDKAVYCEVDSILPVKPEFEFLRKRCFKDNINGFLIKNMKMCGLYSNGIIFPMDIVKKDYKPLYDVTDEIGIRKYEPEEDASPKKQSSLCSVLMKYKITRWLAKIIFLNNKRNGFPVEYIAKSDETNIMNEKAMYDKWKYIPCYITRKMEGQSVTMIMLPKGRKYIVKVYQRNSEGTVTHYAFAKSINIEDKFKNIFKDTGHRYAVQGEFCSPSVQNGIYKNGTHFYVYTVKDIDSGKVLGGDSLFNFCYDYGFEHVPLVGSSIKLCWKFNDVQDLQDYTEHQWFKVGCDEYTEGNGSVIDDRNVDFKPAKPEYHRWEGIVVRGLDNEFSFKVKSNEYALEGL